MRQLLGFLVVALVLAAPALAEDTGTTATASEYQPAHATRDGGPWTPVKFDAVQPDLPTLVIVSDSTAATGRPATRGWGAVLIDYFDPEKINLVNAAVGGRSFRSFTREGRWQRVVEHLKPGDFVVIELGHNDGGDPRNSKGRGDVRGIGDETITIQQSDGSEEVVHSFGWYLRKYIREAREKGATPIVSTTTVRNIWGDGKVERGMGQMREWAEQVAQAENAPFVDHSNITADVYEVLGPEVVKNFFPQDHTHTNIDGAVLNAETLVAGLRSLEDMPLVDSLSAKGLAIPPHPPRDHWGTYNPRSRRTPRRSEAPQ